MGKEIEAPWSDIQLEYMTGQSTCKELSVKYGISLDAILKRCTREGWRKEKNEVVQKVSNRTIERVVDKKMERIQAHHDLVVPIAESLILGVKKSHDWADSSVTGCDPAHLNALAQTLAKANATALLNLGFVQQSAVDVTSGGLSLHANALEILASVRKLKDAGQLPQGEIDVEAVLLEHDQAKANDPDAK